MTDFAIFSVAHVLIDPNGSIDFEHEDQSVRVLDVTLWSDGSVTVEDWMCEVVPGRERIHPTPAQTRTMLAWLNAHSLFK